MTTLKERRTELGRKHNKLKIYDRNLKNDIRYRGPLSYRHLQILGWICISFYILNLLIQRGINLNPRQPDWLYTLDMVSSIIGGLALPLFLFANFAILLDRKRTYKQQILMFGGLSLLIIFLYLLVTQHYILGIGTAITNDRALMQETLRSVIAERSQNGQLAFNFFIDMFLCTLFLFFLQHVPKTVFTGKKIIAFRLFSLIPVAYEIGSLFLRYFAASGRITIPLLVYPVLTTKPFMSFVLFVILALYIKRRERIFRKHGKSQEAFDEFRQTNLHSLQFSSFASIMIFITAVIDIILYISFTLLSTVQMVGTDNLQTATEESIAQATEASGGMVAGMGIGSHIAMVMIIPLLLLFSYNRNHKNPKADRLIPVGGVILAVFTALEGLYRLIVMNVPALMKMLEDLL